MLKVTEGHEQMSRDHGRECQTDGHARLKLTTVNQHKARHMLCMNDTLINVRKGNYLLSSNH